MNSATLFLALRYLRPKRTFVSVITLISILGIAVGVLMMIVVRSVMQGFEVDFRNALIAAEPHVIFAPGEESDEASSPPDWQKLVATARAQSGVLAATPFAGGVIYVEHEPYQTAAHVFGLKPDEARPRLEKLKPHLLEGSLDLPEGTLVISDYTSADLGIGVGDEVNVYPSDDVIDIAHRYRAAADQRDEEKKTQALKQIKLDPMKLRVSGIIRGDTGGGYGYASLATGQKIFHLGDGVSGVAVELAEPRDAASFAEAVKDAGAIPAGWKTQLWLDAGEARLAAMENEQIMMQLVLLIIAAVAAFSVMNTTITVTTQKRREIGVLTAVGARPGMVVSIFVLQAAIVGVIGTALGLIGSFLVLTFRNDIRAAISMIGGGEVHAVDGVFLATIPAHVEPRDVIFTCCISIALSLFAAVVPAFFASRLDPAAALRD
jgi:lipoprotein-releasing system permease protein